MLYSLTSYLSKPRPIYRIWKKITSFLFWEQWVVLVSKNARRGNPAFDDFKPLFPPPDRDWADPFIIQHNKQYFIFIEEKLFSATYGHIAFLALDDNLNIILQGIALKRPYHLSYPFLFSYNDQLFMMPETRGNKAIELYRCVHFPDQWEFFKTVMPDIKAVDASLFEYQGKWWLFTNIEDEHGSTWNNLHLFYADNPLSDLWTPHPKNPVVKDVQSARPAGKIIIEDEILIRPSQDCSVSYGYATNFMQILRLTDKEYNETRKHKFTPSLLRSNLGIHTWNETGELTTIDALLRHRKRRSTHTTK